MSAVGHSDARVAIWRFTTERVVERPWLGWGMDASRMWPGVIPLHPHNAALQVWLELGVVGAACAAVAIAYLTIGALSFGVWQEWWLGLGVLAAVTCQVFGQAFGGWVDAPRELEELT